MALEFCRIGLLQNVFPVAASARSGLASGNMLASMQKADIKGHAQRPYKTLWLTDGAAL